LALVAKKRKIFLTLKLVYPMMNILWGASRTENAIQYKDIALGAFLDIEGTFDRTSFHTIIQAAGRHGIEPAICRWFCAMMENRNISATLSGETQRVSAAKGCLQRGVLPPLLWSLVMDDLIWGLNNNGYCTVG
jgi:hypothetical protein